MPGLRVALCQIDSVVGDFDGVVDRIVGMVDRAEREGCRLAVFPAGVIGGARVGDLAGDAGFRAARDRAVDTIAAATQQCTVVFGGPAGAPDDDDGVCVCRDGRVVPVPGPAIDPARNGAPVVIAHPVSGATVGFTVGTGVADSPGSAPEGLDAVVICDAAAFRPGGDAARRVALGALARTVGVAVVAVNRVGGADGVVFDGGSLVVDRHGEVVAAARRFDPDLLIVDVAVGDRDGAPGAAPGEVSQGRVRSSSAAVSPRREPAPSEVSGPLQEIWQALVGGLGSYASANGFTDVVLGLSGGIDSALVATIATDALGPDRVHAVAMPSRYSSDHSISDARALTDALGCEFRSIPIEPGHRAFAEMLAGVPISLDGGLTEQNLQARLRGMLLMALSNEFGWLVLACGNKSEAAVGYSTLYGDAVGGLSVIGDVFKTDVYALARWRNRVAGRALIPETILTKAPSAELRPGQRDDQSLPPYDVLDPILREHVEQGADVDALVAAGHPDALVRRVVGLVAASEYKRRQAPPSIVVSPRDFDENTAFPLTNVFRR